MELELYVVGETPCQLMLTNGMVVREHWKKISVLSCLECL